MCVVALSYKFFTFVAKKKKPVEVVGVAGQILATGISVSQEGAGRPKNEGTKRERWGFIQTRVVSESLRAVVVAEDCSGLPETPVSVAVVVVVVPAPRGGHWGAKRTAAAEVAAGAVLRLLAREASRRGVD